MSVFLLASVLTMVVSLPAASLEVHEFNVSNPDPAAAIQIFGAQAGIQILAAADDLKGKKFNSVVGDISTEDGLNNLLVGTGLSHEYVGDRAVALVSNGPVTARQSSQATKIGTESTNPPSGKATTAQAADMRAPKSSGGAQQGTRNPEKPKQLSEGLEEIIVSAQKKTENLQDVPIPMTVLGAESLLDQGEFRLQDYYTSVPGLNVTPGSDGSPSLTIRGISTGVYTNPTVGITVDDVPYGSSTALGGGGYVPDIDPSDLARVEVLRGPQGTLYGASSIGGLLKFVTPDPSTNGISGRLQAGLQGVYSGDQVGYNVSGAVNVPLTDTLAVRASGFTRRDPGYIDNIQTGQRGVNETEVNGGRLSAMWRPSDIFSLKLSALFQSSNLHGAPYVNVEPGVGDLQVRYLPGSVWADKKIQAYSSTATIELGKAELVAVSGYSVNRVRTSTDSTANFGGLSESMFGVGGSYFLQSTTTSKFSQELRLSIPIGQRIDWLLGAFYTHEDSPYLQRIAAANAATGALVASEAEFNFPTTYAEYAAFTDVTFHATERFDVQIGGRESQNKQTYSEVDTGPFIPIFDGLPPPVINSEVVTKSNSFTYLVTPQFKVSPDLMVYARFASGYRSGGPNPTCLVLHVPCEFAPDSTSNYDLGVKGNLLNHLISFEAALYYIDWKDIQLSLVDPSNGLFYYGNASRAKSQGAELSAKYRPMSGLTISAWTAWNDAALTEAIPTGAVYGISGDRLPFSSHFSGNLSLDQDFPIAGRVTGSVGASLSYVGGRVGEFTATPQRPYLPAYAQTDLRAGVRFDSWSMHLLISNITDQRGLLYGGAGSQLPAMAYAYIQPRTARLSIAKTF